MTARLTKTSSAAATAPNAGHQCRDERQVQALHDRRLAAVNRQAYARARRLIGVALARGRATGHVRRVNPEEAAAVVLGLLDGLSLQLTFDRRLMTLSRAARLAETVLARYLTPGDPR